MAHDTITVGTGGTRCARPGGFDQGTADGTGS